MNHMHGRNINSEKSINKVLIEHYTGFNLIKWFHCIAIQYFIEREIHIVGRQYLKLKQNTEIFILL